jgi:hemerythrin-like metal-binding protein
MACERRKLKLRRVDSPLRGGLFPERRLVTTAMAVNSYIEWTEALGVDGGAIDDDHRQLIALINRIYRASHLDTESTGRHDLEPEDIGDILCELAEYTTSHFGREEHLMSVISYPDRATHTEQHNAFIGKLSRLVALYEHGTVIAGELIEFVEAWLLQHIRISDRAFASYLEQCGTQSRPLAPLAYPLTSTKADADTLNHAQSITA